VEEAMTEPVGDTAALTDEERALMNCDCVKYDGSHYDTCLVPVVESIIAERVTTARAQAADQKFVEFASRTRVFWTFVDHSETGGARCETKRSGQCGKESQMKMTEDEYALYSAINHADDEWTPEATAVLNQIKARVWDEGCKAGFGIELTMYLPPNPYRTTENTDQIS
jgi:hypothetical protein